MIGIILHFLADFLAYNRHMVNFLAFNFAKSGKINFLQAIYIHATIGFVVVSKDRSCLGAGG